MLKKTHIIIIIILLLCSYNVFALRHINGLLFSSSAERINDRTSLILFDDKSLKLNDSFRIDFELSIWDIKQFGYILRVINESKQEINFAFVNFYGEDKMYLDFHSPITHKSVQIPITKQDIEEKRWLPISIKFNLEADQAEVTCQDSSYFCQPIGLKNPSFIKLIFGLYGPNLDVPEMAIRNINIEEARGKKYNIPLDEVQGEKVRDSKGRVKGSVKNPEWLVNKHFYWNEMIRFESDPMSRITYDEKHNRVLVVDENSVLAYSMRYGAFKQPILNFSFILREGGAAYDNENDILYIYNSEQEKKDEATMAFINLKDHSVKYKFARIDHQLYHHNVYLEQIKNNLYIFGGYGNHSFSNKMFIYDFITDQWNDMEFVGDEICPRYFSALGQGIIPSQILIMGGIGNKSGKQEHGGRYLYDLFLVDLTTQQIKKIWEIDNVQSDFVPCSNLILNKEGTHFFTLCYPQHQTNSILQLYKFNISDGSYEIVSDSIHINTEQVETSVYLFYNELLQEFYSIIRENTYDGQAEIRIYSLLAPPIHISELESNNKPSLLWLITSLLALMIIPFVAWLNKKKKDSTDNSILLKETIDGQINEDYREKSTKNAVFVFGDFTVFDKNGKDISYRFSPKLRSLFALILFHSIENEGISTDMLTAELWSNKDTNSAKNIRGVTINRLRGILKDICGISLLLQDSKWYFSLDTSFYCDYIEYKEIVSNIKDKNADEDNNMFKLFAVLKRGALFPNLQESWIDNHKHGYENEIEKILWNYILKLSKNKKYTELIKYIDLYFIIDPLNEEAFKLYMHALQKTGKKNQANLLYNKFVSNYQQSIGEKPDLI